PATKPGDGYSGDLCLLNVQASIHYSDGSNGKLETKKTEENIYSFIVKLANPDPIMAHIQTVLGINMREFKIYSDFIQKLNKFQEEKTDNEFPINIPEYIYGKCSGDEFVLVMQNMKVLDYVTNPKETRMNLCQTKKVLEQLASLHAVSYAYEEMHNFLANYPFLKADKFTDLLLVGMSTSLDLSVAYLESLSGKENLAKKIKVARSNVIKTCKESFKYDPTPQIMCLMHGDSWNNNILFSQKEDEHGTKSVKDSDDAILIDWQATHWNTPVADLHYFINSSTSTELRKDHLDDVLKHYHTIFTEATIKLGTPVPAWTFEQFKKEYDQMKVYGFLKGLLFAQMLSEFSATMRIGDVPTGPPNPVVKSIKKGIAKAMVPLVLRPSIMEAGIKKFTKPLKEELLEGKTQLLCDAYLDLLLEADENGIFDIELPSSDEDDNGSRSLKCI
ncbi:unnamed protein product, partial [Meganyctiphanes norvegica]